MKKLLLIAFLLSGSFAFSQFVLEHTYTENGVRRVKLEYSGEKYYLFNNVTREVILYNADHTYWKSIPVGLANATYTVIEHLSEAKINPDANIEIAFTSYFNAGDVSHRTSKVVSENGNTLLTVSEADNLILDEIPGLSNKLIANMLDKTSIVFSLPSMETEHIYPEGSVKRVKLENSGEKYYVMDATGNQAKILNSDHTIWKSVPLTKPADADYKAINLISETVINDDPLVELSYTYYQASNNRYFESKLLNENGLVLLTVPNATGLFLDKKEGLATRLMTRNSSSGNGTSVYGLHSLSLEHIYPTLTERVRMSNGEEKFFSYYLENRNCMVYNSDHSVWKNIPLPLPANADEESLHVTHVSDMKVNDDGLVEIAFGYTVPLLPGFYYEYKVINELGNLLLTIPNCIDFTFFEMEGSGDKFIGLMILQNSGFFATVYHISEILNTNQATEKQKNVLYPNPVSSLLHIQPESEISQVNFYNATGALVRQFNGENISEIPVEELATGFYMVHLMNAAQQNSVYKIIVSK